MSKNKTEVRRRGLAIGSMILYAWVHLHAEDEKKQEEATKKERCGAQVEARQKEEKAETDRKIQNKEVSVGEESCPLLSKEEMLWREGGIVMPNNYSLVNLDGIIPSW